MTLMATDPEVRQLSLAYARAVAVAERLANELDQTVADLVCHIKEDDCDPPSGTAAQNKAPAREEGDREPRTRRRR